MNTERKEIEKMVETLLNEAGMDDTTFWSYIAKCRGKASMISQVIPTEQAEAFSDTYADKFNELVSAVHEWMSSEDVGTGIRDMDMSDDSIDYAAQTAVSRGEAFFNQAMVKPFLMKRLKETDFAGAVFEYGEGEEDDEEKEVGVEYMEEVFETRDGAREFVRALRKFPEIYDISMTCYERSRWVVAYRIPYEAYVKLSPVIGRAALKIWKRRDR